MSRRPAPEVLSPRALARLRAASRDYVPTAVDLDPEPRPHGLGTEEPRSGDARTGVDGGAPGPDEPDVGGAGPGHDGERGRGPGGGTAGRHARVAPPRAWARLPAAFVGARWQPGRAALVGVVVMAALAVAVFGLRVAWAQSATEGTVLAPGGGARAGPSGVTAGAVPVGAASPSASASGFGAGAGAGGAAGATPGAAGAGTASGVVVVHVVGQVRHPGVRSLPVGSRVADAVEAAGGATRTADLSLLNLARVLVDGEQVRVPAPGEEVAGAPAVPGMGAGGAGGAPGGGAGPVSLNTADLAALDTLPGVGPVLAQRILDWRAAHGRFASVDELGEVSGIGDKLLAQLSPLVTL